MAESDNVINGRKLAELLSGHQVLHAAQLELALADQEINDLPLEEILLVRGWLTEDKLYELAPWLKPGSKEKAPWDTSDSKPDAKPAAPLTNPTGPKPEWKPSVVIDAPEKPNVSAGKAESKPAGTARGGDEKPAPKPQDLPKAPPQRPHGAPTTEVSPVEGVYEDNLKTYKEILRKILSTAQQE